jgi:pyruvate/2-oxoglutarate dehydrogenase complex dihydrolipoamide dehydrogenase (E3) component
VSRLVLPKQQIHEQLTSAATVNQNEFHIELAPIDDTVDASKIPASVGPFNAVITAIGRHPNIEMLGLDVANVALENGLIKTNEWQETSNPNTFAVGDVCGPLLLTPGTLTCQCFQYTNTL